MKMDDVAQVTSNDGILKNAARLTEEEEEARPGESSAGEAEVRDGEVEAGASTERKRRPWAKKKKSYSHVHFKVYKRRWFGLAQLVLLNVVVSWDVSKPSSIVHQRITRPHNINASKQRTISNETSSGLPSLPYPPLQHSISTSPKQP
jgi:hypothetical protein